MSEFLPGNDLEHALLAAVDDKSQRAAFYRKLADAPLLVLADESPGDVPADGLTQLQPGERLQIPTIEVDGRPHVPVFASEQRLREAVDGPAAFYRIPGRQLFETVRGSDVFLNPGCELGKQFTAREVAAIADGQLGQG